MRRAARTRRRRCCGSISAARCWSCAPGACAMSAQFRWLDPPPAAAVQRAEQLLRQLGAVEAGGAVTDIGRRMLQLAVPPRLARMLVEAERRGCAADGALLAALASERDICLRAARLRRQCATQSLADGQLRSAAAHAALRRGRARGFDAAACRSLDLDARSVRAVERPRRQLRARPRW